MPHKDIHLQIQTKHNRYVYHIPSFLMTYKTQRRLTDEMSTAFSCNFKANMKTQKNPNTCSSRKSQLNPSTARLNKRRFNCTWFYSAFLCTYVCVCEIQFVVSSLIYSISLSVCCRGVSRSLDLLVPLKIYCQQVPSSCIYLLSSLRNRCSFHLIDSVSAFSTLECSLGKTKSSNVLVLVEEV